MVGADNDAGCDWHTAAVRHLELDQENQLKRRSGTASSPLRTRRTSTAAAAAAGNRRGCGGLAAPSVRRHGLPAPKDPPGIRDQSIINQWVRKQRCTAYIGCSGVCVPRGVCHYHYHVPLSRAREHRSRDATQTTVFALEHMFAEVAERPALTDAVARQSVLPLLLHRVYALMHERIGPMIEHSKPF